MRSFRACLLILAFCLAMSLCIAGIAEEEIVSAPVDLDVGEAESIGINGLFSEGELFGSREVFVPDIKTVAATNSDDFEISSDGVFIRYTGIDNAITLPKGIKEIGIAAFADDTNIKSVVIPAGVLKIGYRAFQYCSAITEMILPDTLTEIDELAFDGCSSLKSIIIPSSVRTICDSTFLFCDALQNVVIQEGVITIENAFEGCSALESITIPASVIKIDRTAFNYCGKLIIRGTPGSYAEAYANNLGIPFNAPIISFNLSEGETGSEGIILHISKSRIIDSTQRPSDLATTLVWSSSDENVAKVSNDGTVTALSEGIATITAATANGQGKAAQATVTVPEPTSIYMNSDEMEHLTVGDTMWIGASVYTPYSGLVGKFPLQWSTSDSAIVSIESSGQTDTGSAQAFVKAHKPGSATISVDTADGGHNSVIVTVDLPKPNTININNVLPKTILPGDSFTLTTSMTPDNAASALTWYSSDTSIATVNGNGKVTALAPGYVAISVMTENYLEDSIDVIIVPDNPTKISLNKSKATLGARDTLQLTAKLTPADTKTKLTWKSNEPKIAKVSKDGKVTALKKGTAIVTVTATNGRSAKVTITVKPGPSKVTLYKGGKALKKGASLTLKKGKTLQLKAKLPSGTLSTLTWKSDKPKIAKVSKTGKVTALKKGTATITVRTANGKKAAVKIKVE